MRLTRERLVSAYPALIALALPTVFMPNLFDGFVLPRASIVVAGACLGAGLAVLTPGRPTLGWMKWPLLLAAGAALVAFAFSVSWPLSFIGSYTRYESMPVRIAYLGLLAVPVWLLRGDRSREVVVVAFVFGTSVACLEAVQQQLSHAPFRPDGNIGNAGLLGGLVAMALPLAVARGLTGGRFVVAWWLGVAVLLGGLYVSTSRAGGLGALAGCLLLAVISLRGYKALLGAGAAAATLALALLLVLVSPLRLLNGDPGPARVHLWADAVHLIAARPLFGWGEDTTGLVLGRFLSRDWSGPYVTFDRVHSGLLDLAATQGVLGVAATGWVLLVLAQGLWHRRFDRAAGPIAAALAGFTVWVLFNFDWAPATGVFWLLAGTAWSAIRAAEAPEAPAIAPSTTLVRARQAAAAAGLALAAAALGSMPILADAWYTQGRSDLAVRADPLQAQYHRALGEDLIAQGFIEPGLQELRLAARLGDSDPGLYVELGDEELRAGNLAQARADYQMALAVDPFWAPARQRLATAGGLATE